MCVNDVLVQGAEPLFFLDYFATGKLDVDTTVAVVGGIAKGCELAGCALIGGETAEMPDMYPPGEYDLAGFCVGAVEKSQLIDGNDIEAGDVILGIASSGPHSNGYSLIRKILERAGNPLRSGPRRRQARRRAAGADHDLRQADPGTPEATAGARHGAHHRWRPQGKHHPRRAGTSRHRARAAAIVELPPVFEWLQREGNVAREEMCRTFNCGIGFTVILPRDAVERRPARCWPSTD